MRAQFAFLALLVPWALLAQAPVTSPGTALSLTRSVNVPLNAVQLYDAALEAWTWTFGKEPGAKLLRSDRSDGTLHGTARMNFRSKLLTGREETMGTVRYDVVVQVQAGDCRITISDLNHTGNRNTARGGIHLQKLMRDDEQAFNAGGMGRTNIVRVHRELREVTTQHIQALLQAFEGRLRARVEP